MTSATSGELLLLSGGLDSSALAAIRRPALALFVNYGQRPAAGELKAARAVARQLQLEFAEVDVDLTAIGGGLLAGEDAIPGAPSPEWWPFRNQLLGTVAAAVALRHGLTTVAFGTVLGDGERHLDGTAGFFSRMSDLTSFQEGGVSVVAPALETLTEDLIRDANVGMEILGWTVSCHRAPTPCGSCPGCYKRDRVLGALGLIRDQRAP